MTYFYPKFLEYQSFQIICRGAANNAFAGRISWADNAFAGRISHAVSLRPLLYMEQISWCRLLSRLDTMPHHYCSMHAQNWSPGCVWIVNITRASLNLIQYTMATSVAALRQDACDHTVTISSNCSWPVVHGQFLPKVKILNVGSR